MKIASRLANISESATMAISSKAKAMAAQGINVVIQEHLAGVIPEDRGAFYKYSLKDPDDFIM